MPHQRVVQISLVIALLSDLLAIGLFGSYYLEFLGILPGSEVRANPLVRIRQSLFVEYVDDREVFELPPNELLARGFKLDPPSLLEEWREDGIFRKLGYTPRLEELRDSLSPVELSRLVVLSFSKNGGEGEFCEPYPFQTLDQNLSRIGEGTGCGVCSDHGQAMIALSQALGMTIREVGNTRHTFNEVYWPEKKKWVFVDPQFAIFARGPDGAYLSLVQMRDLYKAGRELEIQYEFFGNEHHWLDTNDIRDLEWYDGLDAFSDIRVAFGSNVLEQDLIESRLEKIPKPLRQAYGYLTGVFPWDVRLVDEASVFTNELRQTRIRFLSFSLFLIVVNVLPLVLMWRSRRQKILERPMG